MRILYPTLLFVLLTIPVPAPIAAQVAVAGSLPPVTDPMDPPGRLVDVGGYRLHIYCAGPRDAPVVLFDAGLGGFSMDWWFVMSDLATDTHACAYDRAGYGWSDMGPGPRDTERITDELATLLERSGLPGPYVLVGHSFGGYNVRYFAAVHPRQVAGVVLVDASHPDQSERLPALPADADRVHRGTTLTLYDPRTVQAHYPEEMWFAMGALMSSGKALATYRREFANFEVSADEVRASGPMPGVPLVVVSRGLRAWPDTPLGNALERAWREMQADLAAGVPGARHVIANHSGHLVQLDEPAVVAAAVREVVAAACRRRSLECGVRTP